MKKAIFPGSFDPVTNGHVDIIKRAAAIFDEVTVAVCNNPDKASLFTLEKRLALIEEACADMKNVKVDSFTGLLIDYCRDNGIGTVVRGVRDMRDFDYEMELSDIYYMTGELESVFLPSRGKYAHVSSSMVRELIRGGRSIAEFVPLDEDEAK